MYLIRHSSPTIAVSSIHANPVVALLLGMPEQHEQENITPMIRQDMTLHLTKKRSARK